MYRSALRSSPRIAHHIRQSAARAGGRRFASTAPASKPRSWKSSAVRWGLAIGAIYYYNTSTAFAEEPPSNTIEPPAQFSDEDLPTVEAVIAQKRREAEARLQKAASPASPEPAVAANTTSPTAPARDVAADGQGPPRTAVEGSPEALEEEADQQGAFNPETGEINWDCPCLGGMAYGPCGEEFRAAFSCFVYSKEEPKGIDCIDKFQHMQDCFRQHPEVYGDELADDEADANAQSPTEGSPETANAQVATTERTNSTPSEQSSRPSGPTGDAASPKKTKAPVDNRLPSDVKNAASPK